jgi:hypothetical protein
MKERAMVDMIFQGFLQEQYIRGMELTSQSDLLELMPISVSGFNKTLVEPGEGGQKPSGPVDLSKAKGAVSFGPPNKNHPNRYLAKFSCKGLVRSAEGKIVEASEFHVGIWFSANYLRHANPFETLTWLYPFNIWQPNVLPPGICVGKIPAGTELVDLLYQVFEIITYHNWASHDALNHDAAQWARNNQHRFPVDRRPLKRRAVRIQVHDAGDAPAKQ